MRHIGQVHLSHLGLNETDVPVQCVSSALSFSARILRAGSVAQGIEHRSPKAGVVRSNRIWGTRIYAGRKPLGFRPVCFCGSVYMRARKRRGQRRAGRLAALVEGPRLAKPAHKRPVFLIFGKKLTFVRGFLFGIITTTALAWRRLCAVCPSSLHKPLLYLRLAPFPGHASIAAGG